MNETTSSRRSFLTLIRNLLIVLLLVGGATGYWRFSATQHSSTQQIYDNLAVEEVRLHNLEQTVNAQEKRLSTLEEKSPATTTAIAPVPPAAPAPAGVIDSSTAGRITALEKTLSTLKSAPANTSPALSAEDITRTLHLLSALHHLSDKVMSGKPYTAELATLEELTNEDEVSTKALESLSSYADSGIPTLASLLASFDNATQQLNITESTPPANASAWDRFIYNITHIVQIRRIDDMQAGKSVDAIVGRAQAHLEQEETEAAIAEIQSLPDDTRSIFTGWLDEAQMYIKAPGAMETLEDRVMLLAFHAAPPPVDSPKKSP